MKKGYILSWGTLIFFVFLLISVVIFRNALIAKYKWVLSNGMLALIAWFSILIKRPFTTQYAREQVPQEHWNSPLCVEIDNNYIENAIRPFALGRKNWLFNGSPAGAKAGATLLADRNMQSK